MTRWLNVGILAAVLAGGGACDDDDLFGPDLGPTVGPEHSGVLLELSFPEQVPAGESVPFRALLTNIGSEPYTIDDPHGETYEFEVVWELNRNESGTVGAGDYLVFSVFYPLLPPALVSETRSITITGH